jgi:hypothetical protein
MECGIITIGIFVSSLWRNNKIIHVDFTLKILEVYSLLLDGIYDFDVFHVVNPHVKTHHFSEFNGIAEELSNSF